MTRLTQRVVMFYNYRGTAEQWIKVRQERCHLDAPVVSQLLIGGNPGSHMNMVGISFCAGDMPPRAGRRDVSLAGILLENSSL
jgi:hypothetical protein